MPPEDNPNNNVESDSGEQEPPRARRETPQQQRRARDVMIILNPLPDQSVWRLKGRYWMTHL